MIEDRCANRAGGAVLFAGYRIPGPSSNVERGGDYVLLRDYHAGRTDCSASRHLTSFMLARFGIIRRFLSLRREYL